MVALAIWATKLLLKLGSDANSACRVEKLAARMLLLSLCSTLQFSALLGFVFRSLGF
jgi:hypothetical protein